MMTNSPLRRVGSATQKHVRHDDMVNIRQIRVRTGGRGVQPVESGYDAVGYARCRCTCRQPGGLRAAGAAGERCRWDWRKGRAVPADQERAWRATRDGIEVRVRLTPKAARDAVEGLARLDDGTAVLRVRVRAVPEAGRANAALTELIAARVGVAKSRVRVVAGAASRLKLVVIGGEPGALAAQLEALCAKAGRGSG